MSDLSQPDGKPALSPEAMLRALGVQQPGSSVEWDAALRLVVIGNDLRDASAPANNPEAGYFVAQGAVATFAAHRIVAGSRGCWVIPGDASVAVLDIRRYDSIAAQEALEPFVLIATVAPGWTYNGPVQGLVQRGECGNVSGSWQASDISLGNVVSLWGRGGFWQKPGSVLLITSSINALTSSYLLREPIAAP